MRPNAADTEDRQFLEDLFRHFNARNFEGYVAAFQPDAWVEYPQSGERFVGRDNLLGMLRAMPAPPTFTVTHVTTQGDLAVVHLDDDYGEGGVWKSVLIYGFREGRIAWEIAYFGQPFPAPAWRAPFVEGA